MKFLPRLLLLSFLIFPSFSYAQGSIFEPGAPSGIFGGINERARSIFEGVKQGWQGIFEGRGGEEGGAIIPVVPSLPSPGPSPPPQADIGDFVKLSLEWDALSVGSETVEAAKKDPLEEEHLSQIACCVLTEGDLEEPCGVANIRHFLWGWCGQPPKTAYSPPPDKVPLDSPGPNQHTLPFAISNKYTRRDGYLFDCIPQACIANPSNCPELITRDNYMEFQAEIYHSNDIQMTLKVENPTQHEVKNVEVEGHALMYSPADKDYSFPHNLDYPVQYLGDDHGHPIVDFEHGHKLDSTDQQIIDGNVIDFPPISIGPFNLAPGEIREFPLQSSWAMRNRIPSSEEDPDPCGGGGGVPITPGPGQPTPAPPGPSKPCECRAVRLHRPEGSSCEQPLCDDSDRCPSGCPTREQCRVYYGIAKGNSQHAGGYTCDQQCIQVDGCPPPTCFAGSLCQNGPQPGDPECQKDYCSSNSDTSSWQNNSEDFSSMVSSVLNKVEETFSPQEASAFGCPSGCVDPPRRGVKGEGSIVPRDFENITDNETADCKQRELKDVTGSGGCGYNASSNNSIIGPIQFTARFGQEQASRSVLLVSLPIGGRTIDDEGRPFGWPVTGEIAQNWGSTGQAQSEGAYRSTPNQLYTDYLMCSGQGKTYPDDGRPRAGDYLHPGINIKAAADTVAPIEIYSTHAGWVTFAGPNAVRSESGVTVQIESDVNQDNVPDYATRYSHLLPGSLQFDVQWRRKKFGESSSPHVFGGGTYVARNQLIGKMGDSGSPGFPHLRYDILYGEFSSGEPGFWSCTSDPYVLACLAGELERFFFSKSRFEPQIVKGPVYSNPGGVSVPGGQPPGNCDPLGGFSRVRAETKNCNGNVDFSWTPSAGATKYFIDWQPTRNGDNDATWEQRNTVANNITIQGIEYNTDYWWRVLAMDSCNQQKRAGPSPSSRDAPGFDDRAIFRVECP